MAWYRCIPGLETLKTLSVARMPPSSTESLTADHDMQVTIATTPQCSLQKDIDGSKPSRQEMTGPSPGTTPVDTTADGSDVLGQSNCNVPKQSDRDDLFMRLPAELRTHIYELSLIGPVINVRHSRWPGRSENVVKWREPGLLKTTKLIRAEASALFYAHNRVTIHLTTLEFPVACAWITSIVRRCGPQPFRDFHFVINRPLWTELDPLLSLPHLYNDTGIELATSKNPYKFSRYRDYWREETDSIFVMVVPQQRHFQDMLEELAALGRRARKYEKSHDLLDTELEQWRDDTQASKHVRAAKCRKAAAERSARAKAIIKANREEDLNRMLGRTMSY